MEASIITNALFADPIEVLEQKQAMISNHRAEMSELENTIDKEQAEQLSELREQVATQTKQTLDEKKDKTIGNLKAQGKWNDLLLILLHPMWKFWNKDHGVSAEREIWESQVPSMICIIMMDATLFDNYWTYQIICTRRSKHFGK